jgi:type VI secretion system protein ImpH
MPSAEALLFDPERGCEFDPFQAVRLLELLANDRPAAAGGWREVEAAARYRANVSMAFPPSLIAQVVPPDGWAADPPDLRPGAAEVRGRYARRDVPQVVLNFFGLFGPQGALPLTYTQAVCELDRHGCLDAVRQREAGSFRKASTRTALRDWLDLFNHRLTALLYRGWAKYRLAVGYQRAVWRDGGRDRPPDRVTEVLFSLAGLGPRPLRGRLRVDAPAGGEPLVRVPDAGLLRYVAAFARRRPGAHELAAMVADFFAVPARVEQMTGQWLTLPADAQTRLTDRGTATLGVNAVAGERVWDVGSKFRVRLGPLGYTAFVGFLPDPTPVPERKGAHLLSQLARLYVGPEYDFEIQLVLRKEEVPPPVLCEVPDGELGTRLGWNVWLRGEDGPAADADDLRFDAVCDPRLG